MHNSPVPSMDKPARMPDQFAAQGYGRGFADKYPGCHVCSAVTAAGVPSTDAYGTGQPGFDDSCVAFVPGGRLRCDLDSGVGCEDMLASVLSGPPVGRGTKRHRPTPNLSDHSGCLSLTFRTSSVRGFRGTRSSLRQAAAFTYMNLCSLVDEDSPGCGGKGRRYA